MRDILAENIAPHIGETYDNDYEYNKNNYKEIIANNVNINKPLEFNNNAYNNDTEKNKFINFEKLQSENSGAIKDKYFWVAKNTNNMFRFNQTKDFDLYKYIIFNHKEGYLFYKIEKEKVNNNNYIFIKPGEITSEPGKLKLYSIIMYPDTDTDKDKYKEYFFDFKNTSSEITNKNNSSLFSRLYHFNRPATGGKKRRTKKTIKTTKKAVKKHRRKTNKK